MLFSTSTPSHTHTHAQNHESCAHEIYSKQVHLIKFHKSFFIFIYRDTYRIIFYWQQISKNVCHIYSTDKFIQMYVKEQHCIMPAQTEPYQIKTSRNSTESKPIESFHFQNEPHLNRFTHQRAFKILVFNIISLHYCICSSYKAVTHTIM